MNESDWTAELTVRDIRRPIWIRQVDIGGLPHLQVDHVRRVLQNGHGLFVRHLLQTVVVHLQRHRDWSGQRAPSEAAAAAAAAALFG